MLPSVLLHKLEVIELNQLLFGKSYLIESIIVIGLMGFGN